MSIESEPDSTQPESDTRADEPKGPAPDKTQSIRRPAISEDTRAESSSPPSPTLEMPPGSVPFQQAPPAQSPSSPRQRFETRVAGGELPQLLGSSAFATTTPTAGGSAVRPGGGPMIITPLPVGARPRLRVLRGLKVNVEYPLYNGQNLIGRRDDKPVDVDLEDQEPPDRVWSSRQHAVITFENGVLTMEDLKSLNGTFVNRTRIYPGQKRVLAVNDIIQIGTIQMKVTV